MSIPQLNLSLLPFFILSNPLPIHPFHIYLARLSPPSLMTIFFLPLGVQSQLNPTNLNQNEYPATAALTTGYVFRVENEATVLYLQHIAQTGCLTHLTVSSSLPTSPSTAEYLLLAPTTFLLAYALSARNFYLLVTLTLLLLSQLLTHVNITARLKAGATWHGARERGVHGSLLILLSQDRWVRLSGPVDDLKMVTSGSWLPSSSSPSTASTNRNRRAFSNLKSHSTDLFNVLSSIPVYAAVLTLSSCSTLTQIVVVVCMALTWLLLFIHNVANDELVLHGRTVKVDTTKGVDGVKKYGRRLKMVKELIEETGRRDWAVRLGMVSSEDEREKSGKGEQVVATM